MFTLYKKESEATWMQWYNLFGLYWGLFFFSALSEVGVKIVFCVDADDLNGLSLLQLVLAGTFASWYWTWDKKNLKVCPLCRAFANAVFFHLVR